MVGATAISASASTHSLSLTGSTAGKNTEGNADKANQSTAPQQAQAAVQQSQQRAQQARAAAQKAAINKIVARRAAKHRAEVRAQHKYVLPLNTYTFTSTFGERWGRLHAGIDLAVPVGSPVMAMSTGVVESTGHMSGYGNTMTIRYWDGTTSLYGHLSKFVAHKGQHVSPGQLVARSGNTGTSTGPHLHLEIRPKASLANDLARAGQTFSGVTNTTLRQAGQLVLLASHDALARAGMDPAPVNPIPWLTAHGIRPVGAH